MRRKLGSARRGNAGLLLYSKSFQARPILKPRPNLGHPERGGRRETELWQWTMEDPPKPALRGRHQKSRTLPPASEKVYLRHMALLQVELLKAQSGVRKAAIDRASMNKWDDCTEAKEAM